MPRNDTDVKRPCSLVVNCKSHFANGNINDTLTFSRIAPIKLIPVATVISTWNLPNSMLRKNTGKLIKLTGHVKGLKKISIYVLVSLHLPMSVSQLFHYILSRFEKK